MAFRNLVEGDCGNPSSLLNITSHYTRDHGFTEEGLLAPFYTLGRQEFPKDANQLVREFLEESTCQTFRMENLMQGMREINHSIHQPYPILPAPGITRELNSLDTSVSWTNEYLQSEKHLQEQRASDIWDAPVIQSAQEASAHLETQNLGLDSTWAQDFVEQTNRDTVEHNDVESSKMAIFNLEGTVEELVEEYSNLNLKDNSALNFQDQESDKCLNKVEEELEAAGTAWGNEFEEFVSTNNNPYVLKYLEEQWNKSSTNTDISSQDWASEYEKHYDPYKSYEFQETNPMKDMSDALAEGKKLLEEGNFPGAILCFEAAVQQDKDSVEAWFLLGRTQAENEQDSLAIPALKQCLDLDPSNGAALMALAVSYTNESYQRQACQTLKDWLLKNEKYKHLSILGSNIDMQPSSDPQFAFKDVYREVEDLFIQAARINPRDGIDPDVQCGLGVLFSLSNDNEKAADCFKTALQIQPNDSRLWNRWGASLANGHRSAEAIEAYRRALELSPGFIRARYNLGISCINLGAYQQAAEHFLIALNQQAAAGKYDTITATKTMSNSIWCVLRLVMSLLNKFHLIKVIEQRDLATLNREFELT